MWKKEKQKEIIMRKITTKQRMEGTAGSAIVNKLVPFARLSSCALEVYIRNHIIRWMIESESKCT